MKKLNAVAAKLRGIDLKLTDRIKEALKPWESDSEDAA